MLVSYPRVDHRKGIGSQVILTPESDGWDTDPTAPAAYIVPLADKLGFKTTTSIQEAPVYDGLGLAPDVVDMNAEANGPMTIKLDGRFIGRLAKLAFGANGYIHPEGATGKLHQFFWPTAALHDPISTQILRIQKQTTSLVLRSTGNKIASFRFPFATAGRAQYEVSFLGSGRELKTYPASFPGTPTNDGISSRPFSYFNMMMAINNKIVQGLKNFDDTVMFQADREDVGANAGYAGAINTGYLSANGNIGILWTKDGSNIEANFNFYDLADSKVEFPVECVYSDLPLDRATSWFRRRYWVRLEKVSPDFGGPKALQQEAKWILVSSPNALWPAERLADNLGPFDTSVNNKLGIKIDGGATLGGAGGLTIPTGATTTVDAIVTNLNGNGTFNAVAEAYNYCGHLMITSKQIALKGAASSVQIDTAVANSAHTALGLTGTVYNGFGTAVLPCPLVWDVYNNLASNY